MKGFFVALLALPAALASPLASKFPIDSVECTCMNAAGETRGSGTCQYLRGTLHNPGEWCFRGTSTTREMDTIFTPDECPLWYGAQWNRSACRPVKLCEGPGGPDHYVLC